MYTQNSDQWACSLPVGFFYVVRYVITCFMEFLNIFYVVLKELFHFLRWDKILSALSCRYNGLIYRHMLIYKIHKSFKFAHISQRSQSLFAALRPPIDNISSIRCIIDAALPSVSRRPRTEASHPPFLLTTSTTESSIPKQTPSSIGDLKVSQLWIWYNGGR